jgi:Zn-finger nucleic acid-binding protein
MICPNDSTEMHQVKITSHYGQPIILEQCEKCGGIWFNESELYRAKQGEAEKIELLDTETLRNPTKIENSTLACPRDQAILFQFTDKYFPKDIILERCPVCNGIWLNRGIFTKYQRFRQELKRPKERSPEDKKLEESISQLIASHQSGRTTDTLGKLGRFLSTPLDEYSSLPTDSPQRAPAAENAVNIALNILMTILRAFILKF